MSEKKLHSFLTGIQTSGIPHLGNYFGSIKPNLDIAKTANTSIIFLADLHSLNTIHNKKLLKEYTLELAIVLLACGLDPEKTLMFKQSDVPAHCELNWILSTIAPMGMLERAHAYKDKKAKGHDTNVGLFNYPILMAADILLYSPDAVPVGKDQKQHLEIARDLADKFNFIYGGSLLQSPEPIISEEYGIIPGLDGEKMSKSYGNTIPLFGTEKEIKKRVMQIVTDSTPVEDSKDPEKCNVFALAKLFLNETELKNLADKYKAGGMGYGEAKNILFEALKSYFSEYWKKYEELKKNPQAVQDILDASSLRANRIANRQIEKIKKRIGLL